MLRRWIRQGNLKWMVETDAPALTESVSPVGSTDCNQLQTQLAPSPATSVAAKWALMVHPRLSATGSAIDVEPDNLQR